jgi:hypothetical protein
VGLEGSVGVLICKESRVSSDPVVESKVEVSETVEEDREDRRGSSDWGLDGAGLEFGFVV